MRSQTGARLTGHGMTDGESAIMDLWEGGTKDFDEIGRRTGYARRYVRSVVGRYNVTSRSLNGFEQMSALGSKALLEAIRRHHPEMVRGAAQ